MPGYGWACTLCDKYSSKTKANAVRHVQGMHVQDKCLLCPFCPEAFSTSNNRGRHIKHKHGYSLKTVDIEAMLEKKRQREAAVQRQQPNII